MKLAQANGHLLLLNLGHMTYCFDLAEKKELWRYNLLGAGVPNPNNQPQTEMSPNGEMTITYEDGWRLRLGRSSVLQPGYAALLTRDGLVTLDPATGSKLWSKSDVSPRAQVFGDARYVYLIETGPSGQHTSRVLRAADGAPVSDVPPFGDLLAGPDRVRMYGRLALIHESEKKGDTKPAEKAKPVIGRVQPTPPAQAKPAGQTAAQTNKILRLYDPLTGKDVWRKTYDPGSVLLSTIDTSLTGEVRPDGRFEVLDALTGKVLFEGKTDADKVADHVKGLQSAQLLADADRYYLLLNNNRPANNRINYYYGYVGIRWLQVPGAVYCFDKTSGKRLWLLDRQFEKLAIVLDRFEELPVIVAANLIMEDNTVQVYRVAVVDKTLGKLRFARSLDPNGTFLATVTDPKTGEMQYIRYQSKLIITPDTGDSAPAPDKVKPPEPTPPRLAK
jgi:outer membrane protein assembly factor BamB